jgi:hypothetical protein
MDKSNKLLAFWIKVNELFEYHCAQMESVAKLRQRIRPN